MRLPDLRDWFSAIREAHLEWLENRRPIDFNMGEPFDMGKVIAAQKVHNSMLSLILLHSQRDKG